MSRAPAAAPTRSGCNGALPASASRCQGNSVEWIALGRNRIRGYQRVWKRAPTGNALNALLKVDEMREGLEVLVPPVRFLDVITSSGEATRNAHIVDRHRGGRQAQGVEAGAESGG